MASLQKSMQGKICLITGATSGIGKATALGLAQMGATVVMAGRDRARSEAAQSEIKAQSGNSAIDLLLADLSSLAAVRRLAEDFQQRYPRLHVLINNAGVYMLKRRETVDGLEMTFAVNYLAPFLLTNLLLDRLKASAPARIVNVSSMAHEQGNIRMDDLQSRQGYQSMRAYGQSKLALTMFGYDLARCLAGTGVTVNSLHPGFVATNLAQDNVPPALRPVVKFFISLLGLNMQEGAKTSLYLASSPEVESVTGKYYVKGIPRLSAPISYNDSLQKQLWQESAKLVNLEI